MFRRLTFYIDEVQCAYVGLNNFYLWFKSINYGSIYRTSEKKLLSCPGKIIRH